MCGHRFSRLKMRFFYLYGEPFYCIYIAWLKALRSRLQGNTSLKNALINSRFCLFQTRPTTPRWLRPHASLENRHKLELFTQRRLVPG